MKYYIKSAGVAPAHDYKWMRLKTIDEKDPGDEKDPDDENDPGFVQDFMSDKNINPDSCHLTVIRNKNKRLCLLTKFKSKNTDYQRRSIYNYLAVEAENKEDDNKIQFLASNLLDDFDKIQEKINSYVVIDEENKDYCFQVNDLVITDFFNKIITINKSISDNIEYGKIAKDSNEKRKDLAGKIKKSLPDGEGILVLVSNDASFKTLNNIKYLAWGLSNSIEDNDWQDTFFCNATKLCNALKECKKYAGINHMLGEKCEKPNEDTNDLKNKIQTKFDEIKGLLDTKSSTSETSTNDNSDTKSSTSEISTNDNSDTKSSTSENSTNDNSISSTISSTIKTIPSRLKQNFRHQ